MKRLRWVDAIAKTSSWTCHRCLRDGKTKSAYLSSYTTNAADSPPWKSCAQKASQPRRSSHRITTLKDLTSGRSSFSSLQSNGSTPKDPSASEDVLVFKGKRRSRRGLILAILAVGSIWAFSDDAKHRFMAVNRALRVFYALVQCVREYVLPPLPGTFSNASHPPDELFCSYQYTLKIRGQDESEWQVVLRACHKRCAERTLEVLKQNGSIFIKLGQHLSSMNYLLPEEWTATFIPLQDHCPVSSYDSIAAMVMKDTGSPLEEHFDHFTKTPIGAASLAQVHLARMKGTGREVAVKLQHPALEEWVPLDLFLTRTTFSIVKFFFPEYDLEWLSNEMESSLPLELDFALEGKNGLRTKEYFAKMYKSPLVVPDVIWGIRRILVMENGKL